MFERFIARIRLSVRGYCPKHGTKKDYHSGPGGGTSYCSECCFEDEKKSRQVVAKAKAVLGFD